MFFSKKNDNKKDVTKLLAEEEALLNFQQKLNEVLAYKEELEQLRVDQLSHDQTVWLAGFKKGELLMAQAEGEQKNEFALENIEMLHRAIKIYKERA
jgi:Asp-tRNA(Asn)/Glu-tRNA(Gln) amidotransferase C subunit